VGRGGRGGAFTAYTGTITPSPIYPQEDQMTMVQISEWKRKLSTYERNIREGFTE
jgi:hypothetical protein